MVFFSLAFFSPVWASAPRAKTLGTVNTLAAKAIATKE
jgi:hypothetical protein